jgi:hypothetical protein
LDAQLFNLTTNSIWENRAKLKNTDHRANLKIQISYQSKLVLIQTMLKTFFSRHPNPTLIKPTRKNPFKYKRNRKGIYQKKRKGFLRILLRRRAA